MSSSSPSFSVCHFCMRCCGGGGGGSSCSSSSCRRRIIDFRKTLFFFDLYRNCRQFLLFLLSFLVGLTSLLLLSLCVSAHPTDQSYYAVGVLPKPPVPSSWHSVALPPPSPYTTALECPETYYLRHDVCVLTVVQEIEVRCPVGAFLDSHHYHCILHSVVSSFCPEAYDKTDNQCIKRHSTHPFLLCPEGSFKNTETEVVASSSSFVQFSHPHEIRRLSHLQKEITNTEEDVDKHSLQSILPSPRHLQHLPPPPPPPPPSGKCITAKKFAPVCPIGFSHHEGRDGWCIQRFPVQYQCPPDTSPSLKNPQHCEHRQKILASSKCPFGYSPSSSVNDLIISCDQVVMGPPPTWHCDQKNTILEDDVCINEEYREIIIFCKKGYKLNTKNNKCISLSKNCANNSEHSSSSSSSSSSSAVSVSQSISPSSSSSSSSAVSVSQSISPSSSSSSSAVSVSQSISPLLGFLPSSSLSSTTTPPTPLQHHRRLHPTPCPVEEAQKRCPRGFDPHPFVKLRCFRSVSSPARLICNEGFELKINSSSSSSSSSSSAYKCIRNQTISPYFFCIPPDIKSVDADNRCIHTEIRKAKKICQTNEMMIEENECISLKPTECPVGGCVQSIEVEGQWNCPPAYYLSSKTNLCILEEKLPISLSCNEGFERHGNICIGRTKPQNVCLEGWDDGKNGKCYLEKTVAAKVVYKKIY